MSLLRHTITPSPPTSSFTLRLHFRVLGLGRVTAGDAAAFLFLLQHRLHFRPQRRSGNLCREQERVGPQAADQCEGAGCPSCLVEGRTQYNFPVAARGRLCPDLPDEREREAADQAGGDVEARREEKGDIGDEPGAHEVAWVDRELVLHEGEDF